MVDIVARLHELVLRISFPPKALALLLDQLSNVEYRLAFGTSEKLQAGSLVAAFQLAKAQIFDDKAAVDAHDMKAVADSTGSGSGSSAAAASNSIAAPSSGGAGGAGAKPKQVVPVASAAKNLLHH